MMVPYKGKGAGKKKQYLPLKPTKWGMKFFVRAGLSGMVYDFIMYDGNNTFRTHKFQANEIHLGMSSAIVLALLQTVNNDNVVVGFDNFFTSTELLYLLHTNYNIKAVGTIRNPRLQKTDTTLPTSERGAFLEMVDREHNLSLVKWMDKKEVLVASNFVGAKPLSRVKRYNSETKAHMLLPCPAAIKTYNKVMGGVDLADMLIAQNRINYRSKKWYNRIFAQLLDISANNA